VARLLKRCAGAVTLAIGDGANDVSMIQVGQILGRQCLAGLQWVLITSLCNVCKLRVRVTTGAHATDLRNTPCHQPDHLYYEGRDGTPGSR
jgi:hydroxymethylpyrimidine pyrophosphatase-like HAD family hydrolase